MGRHGFAIVYLWHGERHRGLVYPTRERATFDLTAFRAAGWVAWIEAL